ncbi:hypothetical protein FNH22_09455 [Fulvivirga sp. M361]|uniref:hypothetical protein n=1 Tax=Fulvivirga sp. M361 TaxID=2594266 RepID=UPI00117BADC5|nr:hypothetical protein [Fulvivirga sp. M361]TRX59383.1 hypothetical protein FNH22_09455 [Fulvivirga sp. M361]
MFKSILISSIVLFVLPFQNKLVKTKVNESITVSLPDNFYPMSPEDIAQRYPSVRSPVGAYTNESRLVDFSVNVSATAWRERDVFIAKDFFKASIFNLYDKVNMIKEDVVEIDGRKFIVFEFDSRINGEAYSLDKKEPIHRYNYIQYLIVNGKTLVFSFNCHSRFKEEWQGKASRVMSSIKVKKNI